MRALHNPSYRWAFLAVILFLGSHTAAALVRKPAPALTPVTVPRSWTHQAQFAGFHATDQVIG
jgi:hypothetical protein